MNERTGAGSDLNNIPKDVNDNQQVEELKNINEVPQEKDVDQENIEEKVEMNINATTKRGKKLKQKKKEKEIIKPVKDKSKKKKINKQLVIFLIIVLVCVIGTVVLTILRIQSINKAYEPKEENNVFVSDNKIKDEDLKYVVTDNDTLDYGNLKLERVYVYDGNKETTDSQYLTENNIRYSCEYYRITGLKDKNVEQRINDDIKSQTLEFFNEGTFYPLNITGEFNGILSITLYNSESYKGLNYNLKTGDKFQLEDVLTKSAPIINMIYAGTLKSLAWNMDLDYNNMTEEEYFEKRQELSDMNNRDTSNYEEVLFEVSNWYKANKGNIEFSVSSTNLNIYNISIPSNSKEFSISIELKDYKENVAIYKRFYDDSIYETQMSKGYVPFSRPILDYSSDRVNNQIDYGMKSNNFFVDAAVLYYSQKDNESICNKIRDNSKIFVENLITETMKEAIDNPKNMYILEPQVNIIDSSNRQQYYDYSIGGYPLPHYKVVIYPYKTILSEEGKSIKYYIEKAGVMPIATVGAGTIYNYINYYEKAKTNVTSDLTILTYYFDTEGNYIGTDPKMIINPDKPTDLPS